MSLTKRWFLQASYDDKVTWKDWSFNPEAGYESKQQGEQSWLWIKEINVIDFQFVERDIEFPIQRKVKLKEVNTVYDGLKVVIRVIDFEIDGTRYRKIKKDSLESWEQLDDGEWVKPYYLEIEELNRVTTELEKKVS